MKNINFLLALALANSLLMGDEIDMMINKINSKRTGILPKDKIVSTPSPLPKVEIVDTNATKDKNGTIVLKKSGMEFNLTAIMNNKAFINGQWVKVGEKVGGYTLVDIMDDSVYLKDGNRSKMVFFSDNNKKIKIIIGR